MDEHIKGKMQKDGHGTLNYKVEWQSLDGRNCLKWFETYLAAEEHHAHLIGLGRKAQIYGLLAS